jgi:hypothetical protein
VIGFLVGLGLALVLAEMLASVSLRIDSIRDLADVLESFSTPTFHPEAAFAGTLAPFPNVASSFLDSTDASGHTVEDRFALTLSELSTNVSMNVLAMMNATAKGLYDMAMLVDVEANRAAHFSTEAYEQLAREADAVSESLLGEQIRTLLAQRGTLPPDAAALERWLVLGGFHTIGAIAVNYIVAMQDRWVEHLAEGTDSTFEVTATSPLKLRERARLSRVNVRHMVVHAERQTLSEDFADQVANCFEHGVRRAYDRGLMELRGEGAP